MLLHEKTIRVILDEKNDEVMAAVNGDTCHYATNRISPNCLVFTEGKQARRVYYAKAGNQIFCNINGLYFSFRIEKQDSDSLETRSAGSAAGLHVIAPMPGTILQINVKSGDHVGEGDCLAIVEAMKMETSLIAKHDAIVKKVCAKTGQQVNGGDLIIELEAPQDE